MAVITLQYYSKAISAVQTFSAVLPVDRQPAGPEPQPYSQGPWKTLYLLHGISGDHMQWMLGSDISTWAMEYNYAVIMPSGAKSFYLDNDDTKERYGALIGEELVEVTRNLFPLSRKREDTVIGGLSMGGFGAIRNGLKYAGTFGAILALSSGLITEDVTAITPESMLLQIAPCGYYRHTFGDPKTLPGSDKDPRFLAKQLTETGKMPLLFLACGTEDFLYDRNVAFHGYLEEIGYPHEWWARPGAHDFNFWNQALPEGLEWLKGVQKL